MFVGRRSFDGSDPDGALRGARELIWTISATARAAVDGLAREAAAAVVGNP